MPRLYVGLKMPLKPYVPRQAVPEEEPPQEYPGSGFKPLTMKQLKDMKATRQRQTKTAV
jgi:hypothetical protein